MRSSLRIFACDFETTVYTGQQDTEVWASGCAELFTDDVKVFHSIKEQFDFYLKQKNNLLIYFHNLKFDGSFIVSYLLTELKYEQALVKIDDTPNGYEWVDDYQMQNKTFKYNISNMGQWYSIIVKVNNRIIEFRDSLKLLPFSIKRIGTAFKTKHQKLDMEYNGYRYAGCTITPEEEEYIKNDVLVLKEALEIMYEEQHTKVTIGACCLNEYKKLLGEVEWQNYFPDVQEMPLDSSRYKYDTVGDYIRKSYRGGWCYVVKGKERRKFYNGTTADVNSLYPSMMSSESGNRFPVGKPHFISDIELQYNNYDIDIIMQKYKSGYIEDKRLPYFFIRLKTKFYLKENYLPFIQLKGNFLYNQRECLETSDIWSAKDNRYYDKYYDENGVLVDAKPELVLTETDYELMKEHYNLVDTEILDACWFSTEIGLFDNYIEKYKKIKLENKGAKRELAKLFLNNLYGKLATSKNSSFKVAYIKEDGALGFNSIAQYNRKTVYIPIGSAITSYARNFTIRTAQKNYYGVNKRGFIYADTDSIHCDLTPDEIKGVTVHDKNFCCWKLESCWDIGWFIRPKTYIEHITHEDLAPIDNPYYNVKCAGMPEKSKQLFILSLKQYTNDLRNYTQKEKEYISKLTTEQINNIKHKRTIEDFDIGLNVLGKLLPKRIKGGIILEETTFKMR